MRTTSFDHVATMSMTVPSAGKSVFVQFVDIQAISVDGSDIVVELHRGYPSLNPENPQRFEISAETPEAAEVHREKMIAMLGNYYKLRGS